jgi:hypothetical protein
LLKRKKIKKSKEKGPNLNLYYSYLKNNQKLHMKDKIKNHKNFDKKKKKKKRIKSRTTKLKNLHV